MRESLMMFAVCAPFYGAVVLSITVTVRQFPDAGVRSLDWVLLFAIGVIVPFLQSVYLTRELERFPITTRVRWLSIWPSAMASVVVLVAIMMIRRAMAM